MTAETTLCRIAEMLPAPAILFTFGLGSIWVLVTAALVLWMAILVVVDFFDR